MSILDEFTQWVGTIQPDVDHVSGLLSERLPNEPMALITDLEEIEAWGGRIGLLLADGNGYLDRAILEAMPEKAKFSEFERKAMVDSAVSAVRVVRDRLEALAGAINRRISLGTTVLSFFKQVHEFGIKDNRPPKKMNWGADKIF